MPIEHILVAVAIPVKLHLFPKLVYVGCKTLLIIVAMSKILSHTQQTGHKERTLNQITTIVFRTKGLGLACASINPVGPHAVEAVSLGKEVNGLLQSLYTLLAVNEPTVYAHQQTSNTEATAARGHDVCIVLWLYAIEVYALWSKTRVGLCPIPHIIKVYLLNVVEHHTVISETVGAYRCLLLGAVYHA